MLIQVSLRAMHKEICKKKKKSRDGATPTLASLGGLNNNLLIFRREAPSLLNSDDFGSHLVRIEDQERNIRTKDRHVFGLEIAKIVYHLF